MSSQDVRFDESRVEGYRRFSNKLWNATRLVLSSPGSPTAVTPGTFEVHEHLEDRWIVSRLMYACSAVTAGGAGVLVSSLIWGGGRLSPGEHLRRVPPRPDAALPAAAPHPPDR